MAAPAPPLSPPSRGEPDLARPILLYDGQCPLCLTAVRFVLRHDRPAVFRFCALQSELGRRLSHAGACDGEAGETVLLYHRGRCFGFSEAAFRTLGLLPAPWSWLAVLRMVPSPVRDAAYRLIARRRTAWFGRNEVCLFALPGQEDRFLTSATPEA
jgi:predicted DCC family thiol-disulfide oxidoreductase YuxK